MHCGSGSCSNKKGGKWTACTAISVEELQKAGHCLLTKGGQKKEGEELNDNLGRGVGLQLSSVLLLGSINPKIFNW